MDGTGDLRLRAILEHTTDLVVEVDATGAITFASTPFLSTVGASAEDEVAGRPIWEWLHPDDQPTVMRAFTSALSGQPQHDLPFRLRGRDGEWQSVAGSGTAYQLPDGTIRAAGILRPVDDLAPIRASLERVGRVLDSVPVAALILGLDGRLLEANPYLCEVTGYGRDELVGADAFHRLLPVEQRATLRALLAGHIPPLQGAPQVHAILTKSGERRMVEWRTTLLPSGVDGEPAVLSIGTDVTEREQMIEAIRQHESLLRSIIDATPDYIFAKDREHRYIVVNEAFARDQGRRPHEMVGRLDTEFFPVDATVGDLSQGVPSYHESDDLALGGAQPRIIHEMITLTNGTKRRLDTIKTALRDRDGTVYGVLGYSRDVTEREDARRATATAYEDVRRSEALLQAAEALAHIGAWTMDLRTGAQTWTEENYRVLGYEPGETPPTFEAFMSRVLPADRADLQDALATLEESGTARSFRIQRPDGDIRSLRAQAALVRDADGEPAFVTGVTQDVTEHEAALRALRENERLLRDAQRLAKVGNWSADAGGRTLRWSDEVCAILEIDRAVPASLAVFLDRTHPEDRDRLLEALGNPPDPREPQFLSARLLMPDGRTKDVEVRVERIFAEDGTRIGSMGTLQDVTEQLQLRDETNRLAYELARIEESSPLPIVMIDEHGTILSANSATERTFDYARADLIGANVSILGADLDHGEHDAHLGHYLQHGTPSTAEGLVIGRTREVLARRSDGSHFPAELTVSELRQADGSRRFVGIVADRTEWRAREEQVVRMQKLEAVGTLIAGVAHDFNNLLTAILGGLDMAAEHPEERRWIDLARQAADRAADLVQRLLRFSRDDAPVRRAVSPRGMVDAVTAIARETIDRRIWITAEVADELPDVLADPGQIEQVLLNLVVNARDAVIEQLERHPDEYRPTIRIAAERRREEGRDGVTFRLEDNGGGMTESVRLRAFDPFFTTKTATRGTGLGLSIVSGIVASHDGRVAVASTPGAGTTIEVWLPIAEGGIDVAAVGPTRPSRTAAGRGRVLLVDDEAMIGEVAEAYLLAAGFEVTLCRSGAEAIRAAEAEAFDVAVLDLNMPPPDGWSVLEVLQRLQPRVPVIIASGFADPAEVSRRGGAALLQKPYSRDDLLEQVDAVRERP